MVLENHGLGSLCDAKPAGPSRLRRADFSRHTKRSQSLAAIPALPTIYMIGRLDTLTKAGRLGSYKTPAAIHKPHA